MMNIVSAVLQRRAVHDMNHRVEIVFIVAGLCGGERRAAADDEPDPPSQPLLELGEDQLVEEGRRAGQLDAGAQGPQLAPVAPVEQQRLDPAGLGDLGRRPRVDPVEDPRDAEEERGPERSDVVDQVLDVAFLGFFYS